MENFQQKYASIFDQVKTMWIEDCKELKELKDKKIEDLDKRALETPYMHSKYANYLYDLKLIRPRVEAKIKVLRRDLGEYYKGQRDGRTYSKKAFNLKLKATDIDAYVNSDNDYLNAIEELAIIDNLIEYIKQILVEVGKRSFYINSAITWIKFQQGD